MKILLLEDDTVLADILLDFLSESNEVTHIYTIQEALAKSEESSYDIYIFDVNLPDGDSISLLKELRAFHDETPTIFVTAFEDIKYLKQAFSAGANDFIRKPFDLDELLVRIENIKRHFGLDRLIKLGNEMTLDTQTHELICDKQSTRLTQKESELLLYLFKHKNRVISSDELLNNLWSYEQLPSADAIRTLIKELRKYIGHERIINIRGQGYRFE